ncbi:MAG: maleylpyruvate isomerase N-terminal domain-containing protein [Ardenticatenaceae bacterium]|nr:maleylpyruvate isomerase N-terminal domain-containing protein [Ardenticatenaceae bacterium]
MSDAKKEAIREKKIRVRQELLAVLAGLGEAEWETAVYAENNEWTISDIVRHLVNAEKGMTGLITEFQQGNNPVPPDFDIERFNKRVVEKAKEKSQAELLAEFAANHETFLAVLAGLGDDDWEKNGRHASLQILTIEQICHLIPDHEQTHLAHIQQAIRS